MRGVVCFGLMLLAALPAAAAQSAPACPAPSLSPEEAKALLGFLEHAPLQGGDAPRFMAVVSKLQEIATIKPAPAPPTPPR